MNFLKVVSFIVGGFILLLAFEIGGTLIMEGLNPLDMYADTEFAENYSPEKFEQIEVGLTKSEVVSILGQPLYTDTTLYSDTLIVYHYTQDGYLSRRTDKPYAIVTDQAWYRSCVEFNQDGFVISTNSGWSYD